MKKLSMSVVLASVVMVLMVGCAGVTPMNGSLYTSMKGAISAGPAATGDKVGEAKSTAILGFATGDSSITAAMAAGGITKVNHVDCKVKNILGIYAEYTTVVYGE